MKSLAVLLFSTTTLSCALLAQFSAPAKALTIFSENFDSAPRALNVTGNAGQFSITGGNVDVIGPGLYNFYPGNGNFIDLSGNTAGTLTTAPLNFQAGDTVTLSFNYGANGGNRSATVSLGSLFTTTLNASQGSSFQTFLQTFAVNSPTTAALSFQSLSPGAAGIVIDNVSVSSVSASNSVPVPPQLLATVLGAGIGALKMRRKQAKA